MNRFQKQPRNSPNEHEMDRREQRLIYRGVTWYNKRVWLEENVMMLGKILKFMRVHRASKAHFSSSGRCYVIFRSVPGPVGPETMMRRHKYAPPENFEI